MSGQTISTSETRLEAMVLPSSAFGVTIPLVGGVARVPCNLIDYFDFQSHPHTESEGGKGGVETKNTTYSYSVSVLLGVGHGRGYLGTLWKGKGVHPGGWSSSAVLSSTETFAVPASGAMTKTLTHGTTAIGSPLVTQFSTWQQVLSEGVDYSLAGGVLTVLRDEWRSRTLTIKYQYGSGAYSHAGMSALGLSATTGDVSQPVPAWVTADNPSHVLNYPGLVYAHGQDYDLGNSASVEAHSFEMLGFGAYRYGADKPDCNIAEFVAWVLSNAVIGAGMPAGSLEVKSWIDYCAAAGLLMSPALTTQMRAGELLQRACELTNSRVVQSYDRIRVLPLCDEEVTGNGVTYTPNVTPVYDLTDDFMIGNPPFSRTLKLPEDRFNHVKVEYNDRASYYNKSIAEAQDDGDIALNGRRTKSTINAPWVCTADVARLVGQLVMQRELNIAGGGSCRLPWAFVLLDVGDLVTVDDPILGDEAWNMRVTQLDEDEHGFLTSTMEDWPLGTAAPTAYAVEIPGGYLHDYNASPGSVDAPAIFEGPAPLAGTTGVEVYVAARGASAAYGGCHVWVSYDGTEYKKLGTIFGDSRYGTLQNAVTSGSTTFRVTGLSDAELNAGSAADAAKLETLCMVDTGAPEFFAHQGATLVSAGTYDLTGLVRAAYGSSAASHAAGVRFVRIDDRAARSGPLSASLIGSTIHVKCLAFNIYGRAEQSLAEATDYTYAITGAAAGYVPGIGGKAVVLKASALTFQYPKAGGVNPSSITLTAERKGGLTGTVTFSVVDGTATLTGSGDTRALAAASMSTDSVTVRASITDAVSTYSYDQTIVKVREGADGDVGGDGLNSATVYIYKRAAASPALPTTTGTYTFSTGLITGLNNSWTQGIPSGTDPVWVAVASAVSAGTSDTIANAEWASPVKLAENGIDGLNSATVFVYRRTTTNTAPALPSASVTYTFATGVAAGLNNSWAQSVPTSGGGYLWITTATAASTGASDTILSTEWAAVNLMAQDGADGGSGADAPLLHLTLTSQAFTYDKLGNASPSSQTISCTAVLKNISGTATFVCERYDATGSSLGTVTMGGSGNTRTLTNTQFGSAAYATIVALLSGETDTETVVRLKDGSESVVSDLDNQSVTLPADSSGVVSSYVGATSRMKIYIGLDDDSANWTFSRTNSTGITSSLGTGANENLLTVTAMSTSVDSGYVDISATRSGYLTQTKRFSISKSKSAAGTVNFIESFRVFSHDIELDGVQTATARVTLNTDGTISLLVNDVTESADWYAPTTAGIGNDFWVRASVSGANAPDVVGTTGTWQQLSSARQWSLSYAPGAVDTKLATVSFLFATDSAGSNVIGSGSAALAASQDA